MINKANKRNKKGTKQLKQYKYKIGAIYDYK